ncbi:MAG: DUF2306 domain-containing protein [Balneolaceae bacterium]|nr:DUF2306 domain-containing protein [Balneolaceae bacterium]
MTHAILILHIAAGFAALLAGGVAIATKKGKGWHVTAGRIYFWSMAGVAGSALYLSVVRPNPFLLLISLFSFFLTWSGYRAIHWKNRTLQGPVRWFHRTLVPLFLLTGCLMVTLGALAWLGISFHPALERLAAVLFVFGVIFTVLAAAEFRHMIWPETSGKFWWMYRHIGSMLGAYIATFTAFLVVNNTFLPELVAWVGPTALGTPLIAWWTRTWRTKLERA